MHGSGTNPVAKHGISHQFVIATCSIINQSSSLELYAASLACDGFSLITEAWILSILNAALGTKRMIGKTSICMIHTGL